MVGALRDACWKSGAGGFALLIVPSLDLVIYKMGGNKTGLPQPEPSRELGDWKTIQGAPFQEAAWWGRWDLPCAGDGVRGGETVGKVSKSR